MRRGAKAPPESIRRNAHRPATPRHTITITSATSFSLSRSIGIGIGITVPLSPSHHQHKHHHHHHLRHQYPKSARGFHPALA